MSVSKQALREQVAQCVAGWSAQHKARLDVALIERLRQVLFLRADLAGTMLVYAPLLDEPDLRPLYTDCLAMGRRLVFPRMGKAGALHLCEVTDLQSDLLAGRYGVFEPRAACSEVAPKTLTLALIPGRAFTPAGDRLGRGGGYYDRLLARLDVYSIAPAYDEQVFDSVPVDEHDQRVDMIVTPERILEAPPHQ